MQGYKKNKKEKQNKNYVDKYGKILLILLASLFLIVVLCFDSSQYITSDSAVVDGRLINIAPKVSGNVSHLYIEDKLEVKKGDLLLEIDPTYYEIRLNQAIINLRNAREKYNLKDGDKEESSKLGHMYENSKSPLSKFNFSKHKFNNYESMYDEEITGMEVEKDKTCLLDSESNKKVETAEAKTDKIETKEEEEITPADIKKLENEVEQAKLDLSNTKVYASRDGTITHISVAEGDYIETAQPIFLIIPKRVRVIACFKVADTNEIKAAQQAIVKIPAYPNRKFKAVVESVQNYSEEFSDIVPIKEDNSDLNKVIVRLSFIEDYSGYNIHPATSVVVKIKTRQF